MKLDFILKNSMRVDKKSLAHKTGWSALASFFNLLARLIAGVVIARWLGVNGNGKVAYLIWIIETTSVFVSLGLENSLTRYMAEFSSNSDTRTTWGMVRWLYSKLFIRTICGTMIVAGFCFFYKSSTNYSDFWLILSVYFILRSLGAAYQALLTGSQQYRLSAGINFISAVALLVGIVGGIHWFGISGAIVGYAFGTLLPAVGSVAVMIQTNGFPIPAKTLRKRIWTYSRNAWIAAMVSAFIWSRMEVFFIERFWNAHEVSMFVIGLGLSTLIVQTSTLLTGAFMSHFAELSGTKETERIQKTYSSATRLLALVLFPMSFGCAGLLPVLLPLLYGESFRPAIPNAIVLVAASCLMFSNVGSALVYGMEKSNFIAITGFLGAIGALLADFLIIPRFGAWGAVWSRSGIQLIMICTGIFYIHFYLGFSFPIKSILKIFICSLFCGFSGFWVVCIFSNITGLISAMVLEFVIYLILLRQIKIIMPSDSQYLTKVFEKLPILIRRGSAILIRALEERS